MIVPFLPSLSFAHARDINTVPNSISIVVRDRYPDQGTRSMWAVSDSHLWLEKFTPGGFAIAEELHSGVSSHILITKHYQA